MRTLHINPQDESDAGNTFFDGATGHGFTKRIQVKCISLSPHVKGRVHLLKLDIEGAEREVLEDLEATGKTRRIDKVLMEYHLSRTRTKRWLEAFCQRNGYHMTVRKRKKDAMLVLLSRSRTATD